MVEHEIEIIAARAKAAMAGPWYAIQHFGDCILSTSSDESDYHAYLMDSGDNADSAATIDEPEATFIAHAREDVPALITALREANAKIAAYES